MAHRGLLRGGQYSGLPGGSTQVFQEVLAGAGLRPKTHVIIRGPSSLGFRPSNSPGSLGPEQVGEMLAAFLSNPLIPQRSLSVPADLFTVRGP